LLEPEKQGDRTAVKQAMYRFPRWDPRAPNVIRNTSVGDAQLVARECKAQRITLALN
jgi:hypothetical protein